MAFIKNIFTRSQNILFYGAFMALLVFVLKVLQWKFLITDNSLDIYIGLISVFFTGLGLWGASQLIKPKVQTIVVEKEIYLPQPGVALDEAAIKNLNLTNREHEVLTLLAQGCTNAEIADKLFLSLSTIKTHVSNLLVKMEVKNRTQALEKAKRLKITH
ncbi:MAG: response regulator transcription factor [Cyclobacteriaceae bacterium]|nr:response regulator transcription factor [Cyclobacteriaceae bacterium]